MLDVRLGKTVLRAAVFCALILISASPARAENGRMKGSSDRIAGALAPVRGLNLTASFDGLLMPVANVPGAPGAGPAGGDVPPAWQGVPNETIRPIQSVDQLQFQDPALAKIAEAMGKTYEDLRVDPPKGRLGGRKEAFTQRDLIGAWSLSFRKNFLQLTGSGLASDIASFVAYYLALEYSYGRGLDFDPAVPTLGDRPNFDQKALGLLEGVAKTLGLPLPQGASLSPTGFVDAIVQKVTGMALSALRDKADGVAVSSVGTKGKAFSANLGSSGAQARDIEAMNKAFLMEVQVDGRSTRIESAWRILDQLKEAVQLNQVVALVGPTGTGKSASVKWLAANNGIPHLTVAMKPAIGQGEMVGSVRPTPVGLAWQWGFLIKAMVEGSWVTLEEVNLAPSEVLEFLNEYLNSGFLRLTQFLDVETLETVLPPEIFESLKADGFRMKPHPRFRMFFTMNPDSYSGRNPLSKTLLNRTVQVWVPEYTPKEMELMIRARSDIDGATAVNLVENLYQGFKNAIAAGKLGAEHKDRYEANLRTVLRSVDMYKENLALYQRATGQAPDEKTGKVLLGRALWETLGTMMRSEKDRTEMWHLIDLSFGFNNYGIKLDQIEPKVTAVRFDAATNEVVFDEAVLPLRIPLAPGGNFVPPESFKVEPTPETLNLLYWIARRVILRQNFLLVGNTAAGKTTAVQYVHRLLNRALYYTSLSSDSANEEVEGGYQPAPQKTGKFQWVPGQLQKAGQEYGGKGTTLFIDEFNMNGLVEMVNTPLDDGYVMTPTGPVKLGEDTIIGGAMNPPQYQSRNMLSPAVRGRFWERWVDEADGAEATLRVGGRLKQLLEPKGK